MPLSGAECDEIRGAILAEPRGRNPDACCFLLEHVLGLRLQWYSRLWIAWILGYIRTINLAKRGLGKSTIKAGIDVYRILCNHDVRIATISKTEESAVELCAPVRKFLETNEVLIQCFGKFVGRERWTDGALTVVQRKDVLAKEPTLCAIGIEGQVAGGHWHHIWIDDGQDEDRAKSELLTERDWIWLFKTVYGALLDRATIHINATPYTHMDLVTRLEDYVTPGTGEARAEAYEVEDLRAGALPAPSARWMILRTPALLRDGTATDPERYRVDDEVLEDGTVIEGIRSLEGTPGYDTQQQVRKPQKPDSTARGTIFRRDWLVAWERAPERKDLRVFQYIDPAWLSALVSAARRKGLRDPDWFVIATLGRHRRTKLVYVLDVVRRRCTPLERFTLAREAAEEWDPEIVGVERTNLQLTMPGAREFYDGVRRLIGARVRWDFVNTRGKKVARAEPFALACQQNEVVWNPELLLRHELTDPERGELIVFPFGEDLDPIVHDDQVDALSGAYSFCRRRTVDVSGHLRYAEAGARGVEAGRAADARTVQDRTSAPRRSLRGFDDAFDDTGGPRAVPR